MIALYFHSIQSEWLKRKRSLAAWLVIVGALFTPTIQTLIQILRPAKTPEKFAVPDFWIVYFRDCWQVMVALLLPMGITLAVSLVAQLEYKNNTWKQLHATPLPLSVIFFSKLTVLLVMMAQLFVLFTAAIILSAVVTAAALPTVSLPADPIPVAYYFKETTAYFLFMLPVVAIQYLLALLFRNFLVSVGTGLVLMVASLILLSWELSYVFPYSYGMLYYIKRFPDVNLAAWSWGWTAALLLAAYVLYTRKPDKG